MEFKNFKTLKKNSDFRLVYNNKHSIANRLLIMYILKNGTDINRFGISVSKKVGNSIVRHRLTRLIRECIRLHADNIKNGYDIIFVARVDLKDKNYFETRDAFLHLLKLNKLYIGNDIDYDKKNIN